MSNGKKRKNKKKKIHTKRPGSSLSFKCNKNKTYKTGKGKKCGAYR